MRDTKDKGVSQSNEQKKKNTSFTIYIYIYNGYVLVISMLCSWYVFSVLLVVYWKWNLYI